MRPFCNLVAVAFSTLLIASACFAQQTITTTVPNLIRYGGTLKDAAGAPIATATGVTFAIYKEQDGGAPIWMETQNVTPDGSGQYSVLLGSTTATGLPSDLFSQEEQRWLGVQVQGQGEQPRVLLVSVPYALKAHEAETLAGRSISDFVLAKDVNLTNSGTGGASTAGSGALHGPSDKTDQSSSRFATAQGPTNFTGTTSDQIVKVVQSGTGNAIVASTSSTTTSTNALVGSIPGAGVAIFGHASSPTAQGYGIEGVSDSNIGIGLLGFATATTGSTYGLKGYSSSAGGTGVRGLSTATTGTTYGVSGAVSSPNGTAMWGQATATSGGTGVWGQSQATAGTATGVLATAASTGGAAIIAAESATTGTTVGLNATVQSASGTAGIFNNTAGGNILIGQNHGAQKFLVDGSGNGTFAGVLEALTGVVGVTNNAGYTAGIFNHVVGGKILSGQNNGAEKFSVDGSGNITAAGMFTLSKSLTATNSAPDAAAVTGTDTTPSGNFSAGVVGYLQNNPNGAAVYGENRVPNGGIAIYANDTATSGASAAFWGTTANPNGFGVFGYASATTGAADGIRGRTNSPGGVGVRGVNYADGGIGIVGRARSTSATVAAYGVSGLTDSGANGAAGVSGFATATTGQVYGVTGSTNSTSQFSAGVTGFEGAMTGQVFGVVGQTNSVTDQGAGVSGFEGSATGVVYGVAGGTNSSSDNAAGVFGYENGTGRVYGVSGSTSSTGQYASGVYGIANAVTGQVFGVHGETPSTTLNAAGVAGNAAATSGQVYGVNGTTTSAGPEAAGVVGSATSMTGHVYGVNGSTASTTDGAAGVSGYENAMTGRVFGVEGATQSSSVGAAGVNGNESATSGQVFGVFGSTNSTTDGAAGVEGFEGAATGMTVGVAGGTASVTDGAAGVTGYASATSGQVYGVKGGTASSDGVAMAGYASAASGATFGVQGSTASSQGVGVVGWSPGGVGISGVNQSCSGSVCTLTTGTAGLFTTAGGGTILQGIGGGATKFTVDSSGNGFYAGSLHVAGTLTKGGGSFKIDHPLDPENKYLSHSFVESPDMMNIYNGSARLNARGEVWVTMPEYFDALNRDFQYVLTALGRPQPYLYIAKKMSGNRFKIAGGKPNAEVSWQVTGIRQDAWANANRIPVEEEKPAAERGTYLHPELFTAGNDKSLNARLQH